MTTHMKNPPFTLDMAQGWTKNIPTPFYVYDEAAIRQTARTLNQAFSWVPGGFQEFFAVKGTPNPSILKLLKEEGCGADCSSLPELILSEKAGITGENIMFTSNDTPVVEYAKARELGGVINLDDIRHIDYLETHCGLPELISFRFNPGPERTGNAIIGNPSEAKYGFTRRQLFEGYRLCKEKGVKRFGLHTMVASNELDPEYFVETARMLFTLALEIRQDLGIDIEFVNMGGGIGIPYRLHEEAIDLTELGERVRKVYNHLIAPSDLPPLKIFMENSRCITGPHGYLISRVLHLKHTYKDYVGLDASMANLMRPGMYGAYHHITVLGKEDAPREHTYDVTGSLCENNDKFAIDRELPEISVGDLLVLHDAGAHGHAMGFNYNGKLRSAEYLMNEAGELRQIRRAETVEDYFATLDFSAL